MNVLRLLCCLTEALVLSDYRGPNVIGTSLR